MAPDYLLVEKSIEPKLVEKLKESIRNFFGEDAQKSSDYGRIITAKHLDRLNELLQKAKKVSEIIGGKVKISNTVQ